MIHTYYSNSYEALRALLIHELSSDAAGLEANEVNLTRFFEAVPVIVPSRGVEADLRMAIADAFSVCSGYRFMFLSEWLGFFSKAPLANVIGNEADWILWDIFRETGSGSFREEMRAKGCGRLAHYLEGKNDKEILSFARHVSQVFVVYASYRLGRGACGRAPSARVASRLSLAARTLEAPCRAPAAAQPHVFRRASGIVGSACSLSRKAPYSFGRTSNGSTA